MNPRRQSTCCIGGGRQRSQPHPVAVDDMLLVQELNQLSVQEREQVYNEIHGVAENREETPGFVQQCFQELQAELKRTVDIKQRAYDKAVFLKPSLENDVKFHLMFLRAERYDAVLAAQRLCLYFENKLMLFGEEKLAKDITLDDLDEDDIEAARLSGFFAGVPEKDRSGRTVLFRDARSYNFKTWQNLTRWTWYVFMNDFTDEETQKTGIVNITRVGISDTFQQIVQMTVHGTAILMDSLPTRFVGIHFCYSDASISALISLCQRVIGTQNRIRVRVHYGSEVECKYSLMTFGIRAPGSFFGGKKEWGHTLTEYISKRKQIEQEQEAKALKLLPPGLCALYPDPKDVLMGRGRPYQSFTGNKDMVAMLDENKDRYCSSDVRLEKTFLAMEIYQRITSNGGRFLSKEPQGWKMVDKEVGEKKILRALRNRASMGKNRSSRSTLQENEGSDPHTVRGLERMKKRLRREPADDDDILVDCF